VRRELRAGEVLTVLAHRPVKGIKFRLVTLSRLSESKRKEGLGFSSLKGRPTSKNNLATQETWKEKTEHN